MPMRLFFEKAEEKYSLGKHFLTLKEKDAPRVVPKTYTYSVVNMFMHENGN